MSTKKGTETSIKALYGFKAGKKIARPLLGTRIPAGFPSPATDYIEGTLDLNEHLIKHPSSTFFVRVEGFSMIKAGIFPDDILIVDRSLEVTNDSIIIAVINGELTVKRLRIENERYILLSENEEFNPSHIDEESDFFVWGLVTYVIHKV
ncbi:MAG: translesion error-prone DNA polymerase V autoproteolytic subunit [Candidatus Cloacimonadaceae bacterium]|nr:translesion error-prone DNA polymerase V autoproteolytic subunit [Candidatus Cloacimonadaceae bacterium]